MKLELKIECSTIDELASVVSKLQNNVTTAPAPQPEPALDVPTKPENKEATDEQPTKRKRQTKADRQQALKAVAEPVHVPNEEEVDPADEPEETEEPKNFYSYSEFSLSFPRIMHGLVESDVLTHDHLDQYSQMYKVKNILDMVKDKTKLQAFFKQLIADKVITEKGDY